MPLTGQQIATLAEALDAHSDIQKLEMLASDLGVNLQNEAPGRSVYASAVVLATLLSTALPPRDRELLERLRVHDNAALQNLAAKLLNPEYFSPTGDAHDAILIGRMAFVDRADLRGKLREFTAPTRQTTRMLVINGAGPGGKSYSWQLLQHLAFETVGAKPLLLELKDAGYTPWRLFEAAFSMLGFDRKELPELADDPQLARIDLLLAAFKGQVARMAGERYWLVIDDLNDATVQPATVDAAFALARAVEQSRSDHLWVALLGYTPEITLPELRYVARDDASFPHPQYVSQHFKWISDASPNPLTADEALELAQAIFDKYPQLDKSAMTTLTIELEIAGEKLAKGERP